MGHNLLHDAYLGSMLISKVLVEINFLFKLLLILFITWEYSIRVWYDLHLSLQFLSWGERAAWEDRDIEERF